MQILLHRQNTRIVPVYIRSAQHLHADFVSRNKTLPDWHLSSAVAQKLFLSMGYPQVDLMATSSSKQVPLYYSALLDDGALEIDAFTKDWDRFNLTYMLNAQKMESSAGGQLGCRERTDSCYVSSRRRSCSSLSSCQPGPRRTYAGGGT